MILIALFVAALFLYIVATVYHADHLFFMAAVMLCLPLVSYGLTLWELSRLRFSLGMRGRTTLHENQTARLSLRISNLSRLPVCYWGWEPKLVQGLALESPHASEAVCLLGGQATAFECSIQAVRRGIYRIEEAVVVATDLLGLFEFRRAIRGFSAEVVVYPEVLTLSRAPAGPSEMAFGEGMPRMNPVPGEGVDFYGIREYRPGDELRRIHWLSTAKTGELVVVEHEETPTRDLTVVLDLQEGPNPGTGREQPLEYSVRLVASMGVATLRAGQAVRLVARGAKDHSIALRGSREDVVALLEALARVEADGKVPIDQVVRAEAQLTSDSGAVVIVTSHPSPNLVEATAYLVGRGATPSLAIIDTPSFEDVSDRLPGRWEGRGESARLLRASAVHWGGPVVQRLRAYGARVLWIRRGDNLALAAEAL